MGKYIQIFLIMIFIQMSFLFFNCSRHNPPTMPESIPTSTATVIPSYGTVKGTLNLPTPAVGKNYYIYLFDSFEGFSHAEATTYGVCGAGVSIPYSITVSAGSYYMVVIIDTDNNGMSLSPNPGDYVGVYGVTWPQWPVSANVIISNGQILNYDIDLVTGFANVSGYVNVYSMAPGKNFYIFVDNDTNPVNSNHVAYSNIILSDGVLSVDYSLLVLIPGTYYIYAGVDVNDSGLPFNSGDQLGNWGVCGCNPTNPPASANANINISIVNNFYFKMGILP
ncbi:MAG: hypothetical protein N3E50_09390 [Candidatus Goldbacteria bacterium]|nr:hypothetical protein [Candidatus Goldiibacteriota bacterium]